ncbi:MAG: sigma-54-dependent Fis family transcriptional regulator [Deltaproteobacteria bacterium]|jgi:two-component system response regulator GlrR|nr:sigma-54-dependent Fis family transcriptional regulator [Deltaproteobacteria bacterium]
MEKILVVDDDPSILKVIRMRLEAEGYRVTTAIEAKKALALAAEKSFDAALLDLKLKGENGICLMQDLHQIHPEMPVIILTAYGTIKSAVEAIKKGAYSYLTKPFDHEELLMQTRNGLERSRLTKEVKNLKNIVKERYGFENIITKSKKMEAILDQVAHAAESDANVFIEGESGTGKELIARTLHLASARRDGPFVAINCAAIPETLLESELFGYQKGAFTDAARNKKGLFLQAHQGTFFLDEISEMAQSMQAKYLRVLQEKEFYPIGAQKTIHVDTRFIASSNRNLEAEVEKGAFREDLFYRIHVIVIQLPPLRQRKDDIPLLANYFLNKYARETQKDITGFTPSAIQKLMLHDWPGNVRELENAVECAVALASRNIISEDAILPDQPPPEGGLPSLKDAKEDFEKNYLIQLIELTHGNVSQAAKLAGKYRADLYQLLKKYDITASEYRRPPR